MCAAVAHKSTKGDSAAYKQKSILTHTSLFAKSVYTLLDIQENICMIVHMDICVKILSTFNDWTKVPLSAES